MVCMRFNSDFIMVFMTSWCARNFRGLKSLHLYTQKSRLVGLALLAM